MTKNIEFNANVHERTSEIRKNVCSAKLAGYTASLMKYDLVTFVHHKYISFMYDSFKY